MLFRSVFNSDQVFIVNGERLEKRTIDIVKLNEKTLVFKGLEEGQLLVTQPLINVQEGSKVRTDITTPVRDRIAENEAGTGESDSEKRGGAAGSGTAVN